MALIYIVEDDENIREIESIALKNSNYMVKAFGRASDFYRSLDVLLPDLVLLDVMLPEMDGWEICRSVRKLSDVPIIMLTAKDDVEDKVNGLDMGADDYMTKPFAIQELLARIRSALRKHKASAENPAGEMLVVKDLVMYPSRYEVRVDDTRVDLTKKEYLLLEYLLRNKRTVLTRDQILQKVWGYDYVGDTNVVDVYIRYLRSKIDDRFKQKYIFTMRGVGYVIKD